ncbi:MAG: hypothetical protein JO058_08500 [Alphaproteobacteria bacterium]|nr:hypothetical protein [Alphaproteobacteria bacterium]MBV9153132.1 hypothetical protein [Alphaproteobacteria bacterium]
MEDEGFVDDSFIEEMAWEYASLQGKDCVPMLRQLAAAAEQAGDTVAAQTWRAITEAAARILALESDPR